MMPCRPRMKAPVGKSGPCTISRIFGNCVSGCRISRMVRLDNLRQIVRRNACRHADRDAFGTIDQQVRNARGQNVRLHFALVVVGAEIDRLFVDVFEQRARDFRKPRFRISHRPPADRHRRNQSCPAHRPADSAWKTAAPCGPTNRKPGRRRADGICPVLRRRSWRTCGWAGST